MERLLTVGLDPDADPVAGWVQLEADERQVFAGYMELIAALERARDRPQLPPATAD